MQGLGLGVCTEIRENRLCWDYLRIAFLYLLPANCHSVCRVSKLHKVFSRLHGHSGLPE